MLLKAVFVGCVYALLIGQLANAQAPLGSGAATVQSCRYRTGQTAHFIVTHEGRQFLIIHGNNGMNDLSEIVRSNGQTWIETNGGVAKQIAVSNLINSLRTRPARHVNRRGLSRELRLRPNYFCRGTFPFSPG